MKRLTIWILALAAAGLLTGCEENHTTQPAICGNGLQETGEQCDGGPGCDDFCQRVEPDPPRVQATLKCSLLPAPPLTVTCTAGTVIGQPIFYVWNWADSNDTSGTSPTSNHTYVAAGTYTIEVRACPTNELTEFCGSAVASIAVIAPAPMTATEGAAITGDGLKFPPGGGG